MAQHLPLSIVDGRCEATATQPRTRWRLSHRRNPDAMTCTETKPHLAAWLEGGGCLPPLATPKYWS